MVEIVKLLFGLNARTGEFIDGYKDEIIIDPLNDNYWYDFALYEYKLEDKTYYKIEMETLLGFLDEEECKHYTEDILYKFRKWMKEHDYPVRSLGMWEVFTKGLNINTHFKSIEEAYATFRLLVKGFEGNCMKVNKNNNEKKEN